MSNNRIRLFASSALTAAAVTFFPMQNAQAAPTGGNVVGGDVNARISTSGTTTNITQTATRAAINWESFNVASGESVNFTVPTNGATLNRITGPGSSTIAGSVTSNGTLYLVNPNGLVFSAGSHVTAQNFIATTGNIDPAAFVAGGNVSIGQSSVNAKITLQGNITAADRGVVGIFAPQIENSGTILANLGLVELAGVQTATIDFDGSGLMSFELGATLGRQDANNQNEAIQIINHGTIESHGGTVRLTANGASELLNAVIIDDGSLSASNMVAEGGTVTVRANNGSITESGHIDASGYRGGGEVMVWASHNMTYTGDIKAEAMANSNTAYNGGEVEVSGINEMVFTGTVSTQSHSGGEVGTLLLDPHNITISSKGSGAITDTGNTTIAVATLNAALINNNVTLDANTGNVPGATGAITVNAEIIWWKGQTANKSHNLSLISGAGGVTINGIIASSDYGSIYITTRNGGNVTINNTIVAYNVSISSSGKVSGEVVGTAQNDYVSSCIYFNNTLTIAATNEVKFAIGTEISGNTTDYVAPRTVNSGNVSISSSSGNVSIANINVRRDTKDSQGNILTMSPMGALNVTAKAGSVELGSVSMNSMSGSSQSGWDSYFYGNTVGTISNSGTGAISLSANSAGTIGNISNSGTGGISLSANSASTIGSISGTGAISVSANSVGTIGAISGTGGIWLSANSASTIGTISNSGTGGIWLSANSASTIVGISNSGTGAISVSTNSVVTVGTISNSGMGGISVSARSVTLTGDLVGGSGAVTLVANSGVTLGRNINVTGSQVRLNLGSSGGFNAAGYTFSTNNADLAYSGGAITTFGTAKAINLGTGKFTYQFDVGSSYTASAGLIGTDYIGSNYSNVVSAANSTPIYNLVVNGNLTLNGVAAPTNRVQGQLYVADFNMFTGNGITITGTNVFTGNVHLISTGTVSSSSTYAAGIMFNSGSSLTVAGSLVVENKSNVWASGLNNAAYGIVMSNASIKTTNGDLTLIQSGTVSTHGTQSGNAYGIGIVGGSTITSSQAINLTQSGAVTSNSGAASGITISGNNSFTGNVYLVSTGTVSSLSTYATGITFNSGISLTVAGSLVVENRSNVWAAGQNSAAYGINVYNASLTAKDGDLKLLQSGIVTSSSGSAYGINISAESGAGNAAASSTLTASNGINLTNNGNISGNKETVGIFIGGKDDNTDLSTVKLSANGADLTINQNGNVSSKAGNAVGISILSNNLPTLPDYTIYASRDVLINENGGGASSDGVVSYGLDSSAYGVKVVRAGIVAGRNVIGYQGDNVSQNYQGQAYGLYVSNSAVKSGYNKDNTPSPTYQNGSTILTQDGNVGSGHSPTPTNRYYNASNTSSPTDTSLARAIGIYINSTSIAATGDITLNQTGSLDSQTVASGQCGSTNSMICGIELVSSGVTTGNATPVSFTVGTNGTVNILSKGNDLLLYNPKTSIRKSNGRIQLLYGSFTVTATTLHIDLGGGIFNAGTEKLTATDANLVLVLPKGYDQYGSEVQGADTNGSKLVKGGRTYTTSDGGYSLPVAIDLGANGKFTRVTSQAGDATASSTTLSGTNLDDNVPVNINVGNDVTELNSNRHADNVGLKTTGTLTINGNLTNPTFRHTDSETGTTTTQTPAITWLEGGNVKITGVTTLSNPTTIVASGGLAKFATGTSGAADSYAGIYVAETGRVSTSGAGNLTLIQSGSYTPAASVGSNVNLYGIYVANGGSIGNSSQTGTMSIQQNGTLTAVGTGNASGVYIAGSITSGGNVDINQTGVMKGGSSGSTSGITVVSGASISNAGKNLTINSGGGGDIVINGSITTGDLTANAKNDITLGTVKAANFKASAGGNITATNAQNAIDKISGLSGNNVKVSSYASVVSLNGNIAANNLTVTTNDEGTYDLVGSNMKLSNQAGTAAPNSYSFSGKYADGNGSFIITGRQGSIDSSAFAATLTSTTTSNR